MIKYEKRIKRVCDYIQIHLDKDITVSELSDVAALSKYHFHRIFSAFTGVNIVKYIQLLRLKRASYQLAFEHELKVIDIAMDAHFDSLEAFSRAFKQWVKTSVIPAGRCAVIRHKGSHDQIRDVVCSLYSEWLPESSEETRDFPVYFHYLNFIHEVNENDLITDIYLPLK